MLLSRSEALFLRSQETAQQIIHARVALAFIVLQLVGGCGLLIVLLTAAIGRGVKRYSTWYSFGASWVFSCVCYTLLAFAGQRTGPDPEFGLCVIQMALIYAAPSLTACTTLSLIIHMLLNLRRLLANAPFRTNSGAVAALLIVPYLVWLAEFLGVLLYGISTPDTVRRSLNGTYCNSKNPLLSKISALIVVCCTVLTVALQGIIALRLYRNRTVISGCSQSVTMAIRVMVFSLVGALALGVAIAYVVTYQHDQAFDMILASLPVMAFLIFGSQPDLARVWMCRRDRTCQAAEKSLLLSHSQYSSVSTQELSPYDT
ncbi:hypothetical protein LshimejAT787_0601160 [Lyophyllum shimeji]|uniref:Uncharacterized protein n=1 Tax=Lyophyllum shimeji TaxID=47721 RepID=A0A9P3PP36_LYOSH|nr:hypothetical protein LshimejAT787_0601160 [Lyophyllum shimeji]